MKMNSVEVAYARKGGSRKAAVSSSLRAVLDLAFGGLLKTSVGIAIEKMPRAMNASTLTAHAKPSRGSKDWKAAT